MPPWEIVVRRSLVSGQRNDDRYPVSNGGPVSFQSSPVGLNHLLGVFAGGVGEFGTA